ncbi:tetratricopeptide repeat protein [Treponema phagedenis]|uniref:Tetratricopeptide repeat protein n=1 Tax=Treponema phagedenis TaxID=162 RepID=A0A0B7H223_TREPH|nr:6-bladed beta-propeller [Treponema phagedenis]NVP23459.1 tetratricopeptide repeat protein [Treponema phagedenis]QEJ96472.1 tetratricopeptide repeat protein [Treponema phagedenis]QEJ99652.1 tetratricopeptide repeat protein [Treponema phagedenis]QEK02256.1 tetratricopeptide repeat protein [Treponema phagedenis]QEK05205.1 tetratricopeptide repeat protein [Treponema phagedenis]
MKHGILKNIFLFFLFFCFTGVNLRAQTNSLQPKITTADTALGSEEFRRGVQAYYRGAFNDAIRLLEKALSYIPENPLILEWLGNAYYRSGVEGSALQHWEHAEETEFGSILLKNKIEIVKERRNMLPDFPDMLTFSESISFSALNDGNYLFRRPASIVSMPDGSFWLTAYGSNELIRFDVNGVILTRTKGPIQGFDRPFDVIRMHNGDLLVSEFAADRISRLTKDGKFISSFGTKGRGNGEFIGPQFLAVDNYDNIYVTDFGNARIVVFSPDGKALFTFGNKDGIFPGFIAPAGIAIINGLLYAADAVKGCIYTFDTAGNYIGTLLPDDSLKYIESMRVWKNNLLVSSLSTVSLIDISLASIYRIASLGAAPSRIIGVAPDANGNIVLADYKNEKIEIVSHITELAGGLFVTIERVYSDRFPKVTVNLRVQNRNGTPVVGLNDSNFLITEENHPVNDLKLEGSAYLNDNCDICILVDQAPSSDEEKKLIQSAIKEIAKAMGEKGQIHIVSASNIPVLEGKFSPSQLVSEDFHFKAGQSAHRKFDLGLRLAATELINAEQKRAVIFLSSDNTFAHSFDRYGINDLTAYLNNNMIKFYAVSLKKQASSTELNYLAAKTGGKTAYIYAERGIAPLIQDLLEAPIGTYMLSYTSILPTDFGRAYLPIEAEVHILSRSGKDKTGYFAPLE